MMAGDAAASALKGTVARIPGPTRRWARRAATAGSDDSDRLLDVHAAAAFLGVAHRTLYKWAAQGRLPVVRLGRAVRFRMSALRGLVCEHEEPAVAPLTGVASPMAGGAGIERATPSRS